MEPCTFTEDTIIVILGVSALIGAVALVLFGHKHCRCSDYIFGVIFHTAVVFHVICDGAFVYSPKFMIKDATGKFSSKVESGFKGCYITAVRQAWSHLGEVDKRLYMEEYWPLIVTTAYGFLFCSGTLALLTFFGHLTGSKCRHALQLATGLSYLMNVFAVNMPEYLTGFKNVTDVKLLGMYYIPFVAIPILAILISMCKLCGCGSGSSGVSPFSGRSAPETKKKQ